MYIKLPDIKSQNDEWSCGPNSAARVLRYYGHNVDYESVRDKADQQCMLPDSFSYPTPTWSNPFATSRVNIRAGTTPNELCQVMRNWDTEIRLKQKSNFQTLIDLLRQGKPSIVLLRTGSINGYIFGTWPELHWVVVVGINESQQMVYYTDTNSQTYQMAYFDFMNKWNWSIGDGLASEVLWKLEVKTETIIWIDR